MSLRLPARILTTQLCAKSRSQISMHPWPQLRVSRPWKSSCRQFWGDVRCTFDHFYDKNGNITKNSYAQVGDKKVCRKISKHVKDKGLKLEHCGGVKVKPALTEIDRHRNWALYTAEDLVKKSPKSSGKLVGTKHAEGRGVYVDKVLVFEQPGRFSRGGVFKGEYSDMKLP